MAVLALLLTEPKASQSLPALQAPVSNRNSRSPGGGGPEVVLRSACARGFAGVHRRAFRETRHRLRSPGRHPMPHRCSRHHLSTRSTQRAVVFALMGSPLASAHRLGTALDFRSGADPCESMALRIQNRSTSGAQGLTLSPMPCTSPRGRWASTTPQLQKCTRGTDHPICIFKTDRASPRTCACTCTCTCAGPANHMGRCHARWSRAGPNDQTTDRQGDGIRPADDRQRFPVIVYRACRVGRQAHAMELPYVHHRSPTTPSPTTSRRSGFFATPTPSRYPWPRPIQP